MLSMAHVTGGLPQEASPTGLALPGFALWASPQFFFTPKMSALAQPFAVDDLKFEQPRTYAEFEWNVRVEEHRVQEWFCRVFPLSVQVLVRTFLEPYMADHLRDMYTQIHHPRLWDIIGD